MSTSEGAEAQFQSSRQFHLRKETLLSLPPLGWTTLSLFQFNQSHKEEENDVDGLSTNSSCSLSSHFFILDTRLDTWLQEVKAKPHLVQTDQSSNRAESDGILLCPVGFGGDDQSFEADQSIPTAFPHTLLINCFPSVSNVMGRMWCLVWTFSFQFCHP